MVSPLFCYIFIISLTCYGSVQSFMGNLRQIQFLENHVKARGTWEESSPLKQTHDPFQGGMIFFLSVAGLVTIPCSLKSCTNNALCAFKSGTVECRCPDVIDCSTVSIPVCGSDGATHKVYTNVCFMEVESCKMGKRMSPVTSDKCGKPYCSSFLCQLWSHFAQYTETIQSHCVAHLFVCTL